MMSKNLWQKEKLGVYKGIKEKYIGQGVKVIYLTFHGTFFFQKKKKKPRLLFVKMKLDT